jgi:hypothetical protein
MFELFLLDAFVIVCFRAAVSWKTNICGDSIFESISLVKLLFHDFHIPGKILEFHLTNIFLLEEIPIFF